MANSAGDGIREAREAWNSSAKAWIEVVDRIDVNRELVLDPVMIALCGDVSGLDVLDVGCGEGRFCRILGGSGARIVGVEPTAALREAAASRDPLGTYVDGLGEAIPYESDSFDLVVNYLVLIDVPDFRACIAEMARVTRPGGRIVVANLLPFATVGNWAKAPDGTRLHRTVDRYFEERADKYAWSGIEIYNWHRPLESYLQAFLSAGLRLRDYREPCPSDAAVRAHPSLVTETRVPLFCTMVWSKD